MKNGEPKQRLSDKLNKDLEQLQTDYVGLIENHFLTFRNSLRDSANEGLRTIEDDMNAYLLSVRKTILTQPQRPVRPWQEIATYALSLAMIIGSAVILIASPTAIRSPKFSSLGITMIEQEQNTYLILSEERTSMERCGLAARLMDCIKIKKED